LQQPTPVVSERPREEEPEAPAGRALNKYRRLLPLQERRRRCPRQPPPPMRPKRTHLAAQHTSETARVGTCRPMPLRTARPKRPGGAGARPQRLLRSSLQPGRRTRRERQDAPTPSPPTKPTQARCCAANAAGQSPPDSPRVGLVSPAQSTAATRRSQRRRRSDGPETVAHKPAFRFT